ncbi:lysophospholipid acyltransferase family protein [Flavobacterium channae]|uniref:lysophospholipid acyltransferase family protein n=1 Tax=Flavobacterium channae TaxID=2897181 RepID=UPI001E5D91EF|nr:lysophospholipid acyltransferase family protein [Flavobacterium channae]UGS22713.1 lysophospholipid acyltransferase family protein [Flavobacterium channae]
MQLLLFILIYPILWIISILPFPVFYLFSDFVCFLTYRVIGYRKKVVRNNIKLALPHLSDKERLAIERKFYSHMCDMFLEMIKTITISKKEMQKRFVFKNIELFHEYEKKNKSIVLFYAHYASWEWSIALGTHISFKGFGIYKKIRNPYFNKLVKDIRSHFDAVLIDTKSTTKTVTENQQNGILGVYGFISDQTPAKQRAKHWDSFMGYEVPIHTGGESLARNLDMNVLYMKVSKVKRGYYEATFIPITDNIKTEPEFAVSSKFIKEVEKQIYEAPEFYFWTHKRWKHIKEKAQ